MPEWTRRRRPARGSCGPAPPGPSTRRVDAYRDWAADYDRDVFDALGFTGSDRIADLLADHSADPTAPVLDLGCGTGAVGSRLASLGFTAVDGIDISRAMLEVAAHKGVYRALLEADLERPLPVSRPVPTAAAVSAGTFTAGGVGPGVLAEVRRVLRPGATVAWVIGSWDAIRAAVARLGGAAPRRGADPAGWPSRGDDGRRPNCVTKGRGNSLGRYSEHVTATAGPGFGTNSWLVEEMYEQFRADPESVGEAWREFFADYKSITPEHPHQPRSPRRLSPGQRLPREPLTQTGTASAASASEPPARAPEPPGGGDHH